MNMEDIGAFLSAPLAPDGATWMSPAIIIAILLVVLARRDAVLPGLILGLIAAFTLT